MRELADSRDLPAGEFSAWLRGIRAALAGGTETDVPCGDCSACCTTSHFVHVDRGETDALARIPAELLFPAPGAPAGTKLMGYDRGGRCPMLGGDLCSIYADRPQTCRTYDCRVFNAAGIDTDEEQITRRARRWRFSHPAPRDRAEHAAVRAAARFVRERAECFPGGEVPHDPVSVALLAIKAYEVFLEADEARAGACTAADRALAAAVLHAHRRFAARQVPAHG